MMGEQALPNLERVGPVRLRLYAADFVIINLEALTKEQQQLAIDMQLQVCSCRIWYPSPLTWYRPNP